MAIRWIGLVVLSLLGACGGTPWRVVSQAQPSPLRGQRAYIIAPLDYSELRVGDKTEADHVALKPADEQEGWKEAKAGMEQEFTDNLKIAANQAGVVATVGQDGPFVVRVKVNYITPGWYGVVTGGASGVRINVKIFDAQQTLVDEFLLEHGTPAGFGLTTVAQRLRVDGRWLGEWTGKYLGQRSHGDTKS